MSRTETKYIHSKEEPTFRVKEGYAWINPRVCRHELTKGKSCVQCGKRLAAK